jgi:hypothetical protein
MSDKKSRSQRRGHPVTESPVHAAAWRARAEDVVARLDELRRLHVAAAAWRPGWRRVVDAIARLTSTWPAVIAARIDAAPADPSLLALADAPRVPPVPSARDADAADRLIRELLTDVAAWPRDERDVLVLAQRHHVSEYLSRRAALRHGVEPRAGRWFLPSPDRPTPPWLDPAVTEACRALDLAEAERRAPPPLMRPLLMTLSEQLDREPTLRALSEILAEPAAVRLPPPPPTAAKARAEWLRVRTQYTRARVAVRRRHHRRAAVLVAIDAAITEARARWWNALFEVLPRAHDPRAVRAALDRLHRETIDRLRRAAPEGASNAEASDVPSPPPSPARRRRRGSPRRRPPRVAAAESDTPQAPRDRRTSPARDVKTAPKRGRRSSR